MVLVDALDTPLFNNAQIRKRMTLTEVREIFDWMASLEGAQRIEWMGREGEKASAWIYWRRPEEWAVVIESWIDETGQRGVVLTLYELTEGESTLSQGGFAEKDNSLQMLICGQTSTGWIRNFYRRRSMCSSRKAKHKYSVMRTNKG
jgi:hypothetical protein